MVDCFTINPTLPEVNKRELGTTTKAMTATATMETNFTLQRKRTKKEVFVSAFATSELSLRHPTHQQDQSSVDLSVVYIVVLGIFCFFNMAYQPDRLFIQ